MISALRTLPYKELAAVCNVDAHVTVHRVLAEKVDAKLLAGLSEAHERVERDDICEDAIAETVMYQVEEVSCHLRARLLESAMRCCSIIPIYRAVLAVKCSI